MTDPLHAGIEADLNDAIAQVIAKREGAFVTKWIALVESTDSAGERGLWTCTSDDMRAWDTKGLLQHTLDLMTARTIRRDEE